MAVWITSGAPATSPVLTINATITAGFQLAVEGSGSVSATAVIEGSHDNKGWINVATLSASGTNYATDGGPLETNWPYMRARITAVSGGTATVHQNI